MSSFCRLKLTGQKSCTNDAFFSLLSSRVFLFLPRGKINVSRVFDYANKEMCKCEFKQSRYLSVFKLGNYRSEKCINRDSSKLIFGKYFNNTCVNISVIESVTIKNCNVKLM